MFAASVALLLALFEAIRSPALSRVFKEDVPSDGRIRWGIYAFLPRQLYHAQEQLPEMKFANVRVDGNIHCFESNIQRAFPTKDAVFHYAKGHDS